MKNKHLVIIAGITGAIGNALLSEYGKKSNVVVYGISRSAISMNMHVCENSKKLPISILVGSLEDNNFCRFAKNINFNQFKSVTYIHCLGFYPFEVDKEGVHRIENDLDGDGINDKTFFLGHEYYVNFVGSLLSEIQQYKNLHFKTLIFGSVADVHKPIVHESWWRTIEKTKNFMRNKLGQYVTRVLNISSVICSHEIITRPFVFSSTDANPQYWLSPAEVARKSLQILRCNESGFSEVDFFHPNPKVNESYYRNENFTPRKVIELYS